jgi:hypothetical protein
MKRIILFGTLLFSQLSLAEEPSAAEKKIEAGKEMMNKAKMEMRRAKEMKHEGKQEKHDAKMAVFSGPECSKVVGACKTAGYEPGDHKKGGKGLFADCLGKVAKGDVVEGVAATKEEAKACMQAIKAVKK